MVRRADSRLSAHPSVFPPSYFGVMCRQGLAVNLGGRLMMGELPQRTTVQHDRFTHRQTPVDNPHDQRSSTSSSAPRLLQLLAAAQETFSPIALAGTSPSRETRQAAPLALESTQAVFMSSFAPASFFAL